MTKHRPKSKNLNLLCRGQVVVVVYKLQKYPFLLFHSTSMESLCLDLASLKTLMDRPVENLHFPSVLENGLSMFRGYKGTKRKLNVR